MTAPQDPSDRGPWPQGAGSQGGEAPGPWQPAPPPPQQPSSEQPPGQWQPPPPQPPYGQPPYGQPPYGQPPYGQPPYGQPPYGQGPYQQGPSPYGPSPYGPSPYGQPAGWHGPPLAGWGIRAAGYLIDLLISIVVQIVFGLIDDGLATVAGLALAVWFGYLTGTTGQTPGRKAVGITVLREADGRHLGAGAGIGRSFLHILDALPLLLGFFWPIWDPKKQTFADKIIGSVVVKV